MPGSSSDEFVNLPPASHVRVAELPEAVLLDLDGTLTRPILDFDRIRQDMGIAPGRPILEALRDMPDPDRKTATVILLRHEHDAASAATLNDGCAALLAALNELRIPHAIVTRNSLDSARRVLDMHAIAIEVLVTREDEPCKPGPEPIWLALQRLRITCDPNRVWMVGDGEHDIVAGNAAGVRSIWLSHGNRPRFHAVPWLTIRDLAELLAILLAAPAHVGSVAGSTTTL